MKLRTHPTISSRSPFVTVPGEDGRYYVLGIVLDKPIGDNGGWTMIINDDLAESDYADAVLGKPMNGQSTGALPPDQVV